MLARRVKKAANRNAKKPTSKFPSQAALGRLLDCRRTPRQGASCGNQGEQNMRGSLCSVALLLASPAAFAEYTFQISNNTDSKIVAVHVSEDGNTWGEFNIGSGIAAGATATMQWDDSTDESSCEWSFMATFADGSESEAVDFDFCEDELVIEFN
jgi:hypothetical protein